MSDYTNPSEVTSNEDYIPNSRIDERGVPIIDDENLLEAQIAANKERVFEARVEDFLRRNSHLVLYPNTDSFKILYKHFIPGSPERTALDRIREESDVYRDIKVTNVEGVKRVENSEG